GRVCPCDADPGWEEVMPTLVGFGTFAAFTSWIVVMPTPKECRQNAEDCLRPPREATTIYAREHCSNWRQVSRNSRTTRGPQALRLCVLKTRFGNSGDEGRRGRVQIRCGPRAGWRDGSERLC